MSNLSNVEFVVLDVSGHSYLSWIMDAKIHLTAKGLGETIHDWNKTSLQDKAKAIIYLDHHLHEDLKREYLTVEDPLELWNNIKDRFEYHKLVLLSKARYEWQHMRLQDYKTISDYNSALCRIASDLKFCGEKITDEDMLEKTFSMFHASNLLLLDQYRECRFIKYSELISCLLIAEQKNKLLLENHQARQVDVSPLPEENAATTQSERKGRNHNKSCGRGQSNKWRWESRNPKPGNGESSRQSMARSVSGGQNNICYKCGMPNHWSRTCRAPKHVVEAYQQMMKEKKKHDEANVIEDTSYLSSPTPPSETQLDMPSFLKKYRDSVV